MTRAKNPSINMPPSRTCPIHGPHQGHDCPECKPDRIARAAIYERMLRLSFPNRPEYVEKRLPATIEAEYVCPDCAASPCECRIEYDEIGGDVSDSPKITKDEMSHLYLLRLVREEHASELNPAIVAILDKALGKTGIS